MAVTSSTFSFTMGVNGVITENFWTGARNYLDYFPSLSAQGIYAYWFIINMLTGSMFLMQPFWAPKKTLAETDALLALRFTQLTALNITFTPKTVHYDSFYRDGSHHFRLRPSRRPTSVQALVSGPRRTGTLPQPSTVLVMQ